MYRLGSPHFEASQWLTLCIPIPVQRPVTVTFNVLLELGDLIINSHDLRG